MTSIFVFLALLGGFFWLRMKRSHIEPLTVQAEGFVRSVFPDGTIEDQNENGDIIYVFNESNSLRITPEGVVFRMVDNMVHIEEPLSAVQHNTICGPKGERLSALGIPTETKDLEVFKENAQANETLLTLLKNQQFSEAQKQLEDMSQHKYFVAVDQLFISCASTGNPDVLDFIKKHLNYSPSNSIWEKIALNALDVKPEYLDVPPAPLSYMLEMENKGWITNAFISTVISHRRYDVLEAAVKYGTDFRTHAERMCHYAYEGENIALMFMEESGSTFRALALYLAARNEKTGTAKSFARSFSKEQLQGLKKMFSRLKNNPKQVLKYFP